MKPLNQKERNSFYWQFLVLYLISMVVVVVAVSFYFEVNDKEVQVLRDQKEKYKIYDELPSKINSDIRNLDSLLTLLENPDPKYTQDQIDGNIKTILTTIPNVDNTKQTPLDSLSQKIKDTYYKILDDKKKLRTSNQASGIASEASKQVEDLKKQLSDCKDENKTLQIKMDLK